MRYRVRAIKVETAEKLVSATDEDDAIRKVQEELAKPYGFLGMPLIRMGHAAA